MNRIYTLIVATMIGMQLWMQQAHDQARKDERGLGTLEMVALGLGLFLAATAAILVFTRAIDLRLKDIK